MARPRTVPARRYKTASQDESRRNKAEFLHLIRGIPSQNVLPLSVAAACERIGIARRTVTRWKQTDSDFADAFAEAMEDGIDMLEDEALRRAAHGVTREIYHAGEVVGERQEYSDTLLTFLLAGRRPERYRPNQVTVNTQVNLDAVPTDRDVAKALALLVEEARIQQSESVT